MNRVEMILAHEQLEPAAKLMYFLGLIRGGMAREDQLLTDFDEWEAAHGVPTEESVRKWVHGDGKTAIELGLAAAKVRWLHDKRSR